MLGTLFFADTYAFGLLLKIEFVFGCLNELFYDTLNQPKAKFFRSA